VTDGPELAPDNETAARALASLVAEPSDALVDAVLRRLEGIELRSGETLFAFGDPSTAAYLVLRGRLRVTIPDGDGGEAFIRDLGRGEIVGELGLLNAEPRSATIRAIRDTALARLTAADFLELTSSFPELAIGVANSLLRRAAGRQRGTGIGSVALFVADGDRTIADRLAAAMSRHGPLEHLSRGRVASLLGDPKVTEREGDEKAAAQLSTLLASAESSSERLLLEVDGVVDGWARRAFRSADLVVVHAPPHPTDEQDAAIRDVVDSLEGMPHIDAWLVVAQPAGVERPVGTDRLRARYGMDAVVHLREGHAGDLERLARLVSGRGIGLVLGGGGARGFAHFGVHRALVEVGVPVDHIGGSSMGATLGAVIAQGVGAEELIATAERQFRRVVDYTLPVVSLAKGRRASRQLMATFDGWTFEDLWTPFFCMSTNLTHTASVVHDSGDLTRAIRAGASIPGVFPPTPMGDDLHVDAGVLDNLPVDVMRARPGIGTVIAVDVAPPVGPRARADYGLSVSGWKALRSSLGRRRSIYPAISVVLMRSMILGSMRERDRLVASGLADLYLDLDLRGIGLLDFKRVRSTADAGYEAALPRIREWWESRGEERGTRSEERGTRDE
jgi:predicted acylesterase/phospholipase RssA/CRP-like cAMP-binding protein